ncbi:hypothetical protein ACU610_25660 [Geodermatophilus sp. URMC 61]|uniref:hypothetical protein n=1 Tax=Geodermatophilus sp. URMC 61 TaxID=3423411 RepID=UPI00406C8DB2
MTMSADLFRREALEYRSRPRQPGAVLQVGAPWVRWLYWVVLALVAVGLALAFTVRVELTASGPALVDPQARTFVAVLPAVAGTEPQDGHPLRLDVAGQAGWGDVPATVTHVQAADEADIRRVGFSSFPQPAVLVTGVLRPGGGATPATPSARLTGRAVVVLGSERAFSLVLQEFRGAST